MRSQRSITRLAAFAMPALLAGCGGEPPAPVPPDVTVAQPERRDVQYFDEFPGNTRAIADAEVRARVPGTLDEMRFEPSSLVEEGEILFVIEPEPYQAAYDEAQAALQSARSQLVSAKSDLERIETAIKSDAVSQQDLDRAVAARDMAEADVRGAEARFDQAKINLGYTEVRAPFAGMVGRNLVDLGNLVGAGEATVLTTVTQLDPMFVYFNAPEPFVLRALRERKRGGGGEARVPGTAAGGSEGPEAGDGHDEDRKKDPLPVFVASAIDEGFPFEGFIDFVGNRVDAATGTIEVRAVVENPGVHLFPGLFVRVRASGQSVPGAIVVHEAAIGTDLGGKYLMLLGEGNVVEQRYVKLGPVQDDGKVVVEEGLEGDERYVLGGLLRARPGFPVNPSPAES